MYNIITYKEGEYYIGKILENNVSSFGNTEKEAYDNTIEALKLYKENEVVDTTMNIKVSSPKLYSLNLENA